MPCPVFLQVAPTIAALRYRMGLGVLPSSERLYVCRVDASWVEASVVQYQSRFYLSEGPFVGYTVGSLHAPIEAEHTMPALIGARLPLPAPFDAGSEAYFIPKPLHSVGGAGITGGAGTSSASATAVGIAAAMLAATVAATGA